MVVGCCPGLLNVVVIDCCCWPGVVGCCCCCCWFWFWFVVLMSSVMCADVLIVLVLVLVLPGLAFWPVLVLLNLDFEQLMTN